MLKIKENNYFFSQVHQPFFFSGIIFAIAVMLMFMLSYKGVVTLTIDMLAFHSYSLIYLVFTQFFTGFIFTTYPRFTNSAPIEKRYYMILFSLHQIGALLFLIGAISSVYILYLALAIMLMANIMMIYKLQTIYANTRPNLRSDPKWILVGFYFGLLGHILYAVSFLGFQIHAMPVALYLYFIFVTFAVAQRMVPFFSHSPAVKKESIAAVVFVGLVLKVAAMYLSFVYLEIITDIALGLYITYEIRRWKLGFKDAPAILKILHISLFWLVASFLMSAVVALIEIFLERNFMQLGIHLLTVGFVTNMLIGFGTRVTLGHSGQPPHADSLTLKIFYLLQAVVVGRLIYSLAMGANSGMFWLFDISVVLWDLLFIFWALRFGPVLLYAKKL